MKTYRNLYPQIASFQTLLDAFYKARKAAVAACEYNLEAELLRLERELRVNRGCRSDERSET